MFQLVRKSVKAHVYRYQERVKTGFSKMHLYTALDLKVHASKYFLCLLSFKKPGDICQIFMPLNLPGVEVQKTAKIKPGSLVEKDNQPHFTPEEEGTFKPSQPLNCPRHLAFKAGQHWARALTQGGFWKRRRKKGVSSSNYDLPVMILKELLLLRWDRLITE